MRQNFTAQFVQLLKHWLCIVHSGFVTEKNWALSVDKCWLWALQFSVHLINLPSTLLRCNGFAMTQKAVVDHTSSRLPKSDHDTFLGGASLALGKALELLLSPTTEKVIAGHLNKFPFLSQVTIWLRNGLLLLSGVRKEDTWKWWLFWFVVSSWITLLSSFFTFPICFKCQLTIEWSMLSSWATSRVVVRSLSMIFPGGCCQLPMASHCAHLQGSRLLCKTTWTTTTLYIS